MARRSKSNPSAPSANELPAQGQSPNGGRKRRAASIESAEPPASERLVIVQHHGIQVEVEPLEGGPGRRCRVKRRSGHVVGDEVVLDGETLIRQPRRTELARRAAGGHGAQPVAANLSLLGIVITREPPPRVGLVDRAIVAARQAGIEPMVIVNKADLNDVSTLANEMREEFAGSVDVITLSVKEGRGLAELRTRLASAGLAALVGPSGVGKSSLTNALVPEAGLIVGALSEATGRGKHTTTRSTLWRSNDGIALIDTPGIRDFGLAGVTTHELARHFASFETVNESCRFRDCLHHGEPDCAIDAAVRAGRLAPNRLHAYRSLLAELEAEADREMI